MYFEVFHRGLLRNYIKRWQQTWSEQEMLHEIYDIATVKRFEKIFWKTVCMRSVAILPHDESRVDSYASSQKMFVDLNKVKKLDNQPFKAKLKPWETIVKRNKILINTQLIWKFKAFHSWMACYRLRARYLRGTVNIEARSVLHRIAGLVNKRKNAVTIIL